MRTEPGHDARPRIDPVVPLVDEQEAGRIYDPSLLRWALAAALAGAVVLGAMGHGLATGWLALPGLGQWAVAGPVAGTFTGAGVGAAAGGLAGALAALFRMPVRRVDGE